MKINCYYTKNGEFDHIDAYSCCKALHKVHQIHIMENSKTKRFFMGLEETDVIEYYGPYHTKIERTNYPISFCPFCGERVEFKNLEVEEQ